MRMTLATAFAMVLASTSMRPLFATSEWLGPVIGAIAFAAMIGLLARSTPYPRLLTVVLAPVVGLCYLTALYAPQQAVATFVPSGKSLHQLNLLMHAASSDAKTLVAPVRPTAALLMVTVGGLFVAAVVADFLAVTSRRAVLAGVPMLSIFAVPAGILAGGKGGVGILGFALTAFGWLLLLVLDTEQNLGSWGQRLRRPASVTSRQSAAPTSPLGMAGRRIGSAALGVAIILPFALPHVPSNLSGRADADSNGPTSAVVIPPLVSLERRLHSDKVTKLMEVRTATPTYLRMTALDKFDGERFTLSPISASQGAKITKGEPQPPGNGSIATTPVQAVVHSTSTFAESYLPVPYAPVAVKAAGDWRTSQPTMTVFSSRANTRGLTYTVTSQVPSPTADDLRAAPLGQTDGLDLSADLALPTDASTGSSLPAAVTALAHEITAHARSEYDKAVALQAFFRSSLFTYDLNVSPLGASGGESPLTDFLFVTRRGYCEQFASSMVVLARVLGIPARVAVGFTPGTLQRDGSYLITNRDAHSWPELYFAGAGWIRFEPTPLSQGRGNVPSYSNPTTQLPGEKSTPTPRATPTPLASAAAGLNGRGRGEDKPIVAATAAPAGHGVVIALVVLLLVLLVATPGTIRATQRRRRMRGSVTDAWNELLITAGEIGAGVHDSRTPRQVAELLRKQGVDQTALRTLLAGVERARYSGSADATTRGEHAAARAALRSLLASASRARRIWAAAVPMSVILAGQLRVRAVSETARAHARGAIKRRGTA